MSVVGEVELPVVALPGGFAADLAKIADTAAAKAADIAGKTFASEFSKLVRAAGRSAFAGFFDVGTAAAGEAGKTAGNAYSAGFIQSLRARGAVTPFVGTSDAAASQAAGLMQGRAYAAGLVEGSKAAAGSRMPLIGGATTAEAQAQGLETGKAYSRGIVLGSAESKRVQGLLIPGVGTAAEAEAQGLAIGRASSRGMAVGVSEGNLAVAASRSMQGVEAVAIGAGDRAGRSFLSSFTTHMSGFGTVATLALGVIGFESIKMASKFDSSMELIRTQAGATQAEVDSMKGSVLALAGAVAQSPEKLAEALYHIESDGYRGAEALNILRYAAEGATTSGAKLDDTAYSLTSTMKALGDHGAAGAAKDMAILNAIVGSGDMHFQDLNAAITTGILGTMQTFHVSLESTGAALDYLTMRGEPAQQSATRLAMGIALLAAPSKQAAKILGDLGLTTLSVKDAQNATATALSASGVTTTKFAADLRKPNGIFVAINDLDEHLIKSGVSSELAAATISRAFGGGRTGKAIMQMATDVGGITEAFDLVIANEKKFQDSNKAALDTLGGRWHRFTADLGVDAINVGHALTPVAKGFLTGLEGIGSATVALFHHRDAVIAVAIAYGVMRSTALASFFSEAAAGAANLAGLLAGRLVNAMHAVAILGGELQGRNFFAAFGLGGATLAAAAVGIYGIVHAFDQMATSEGTVNSMAKQLEQGAGTSIDSLSAKSQQLQDTLDRQLKKQDSWGSTLANVAGTLTGGLSGPTVQDATNRTEALSQALGDVHTQLIDTLTAQENSTNNTHLLSVALGTTDEETRGLAGSMKIDLSGATDSVIAKFSNAYVQTHLNIGAMQGMQAATKQASDAMNTYVGIINGYLADGASIDQAYIQSKQSITAVTTALQTNGATLDENTVAGQNNALAFDAAALQVGSLLTTINKGNVKDLPAAQKKYEELYNGLLTTAEQFGKTRGQAIEYLKKLGLVPPNKVTNVTANTGQADGAISHLLDLLHALNNKTITVTTIMDQVTRQGTTGHSDLPQARPTGGLGTPGALFPGTATGGLIGGASFPVSRGDFVVNAASTARFRPLLDAISDGKFAGLAAGGLAGLAAGGTPSPLAGGATPGVDLAPLNQLYAAPSTVQKQHQADIDAANAQAFTVSPQTAILKGRDQALTLANQMATAYQKRTVINTPLVASGYANAYQQPMVDTSSALQGLATATGAAMTNNMARTIASRTPTVVARQKALRVGLNNETDQIIQNIGISARVDDRASGPIHTIGVELTQLAQEAAAAGVSGKAAGGMVIGPGTGTSDSILGIDRSSGMPTAWVSNREFVVNANSTAQFLPMLEAINAAGLAGGGMVRPDWAGTDTFNVEPLLARMQAKINEMGGGRIVTAAEKYLGSPYTLGGNPYVDPFSSDCSGLVDRAFADIGHRLPGRPLTWDLDTMGQKVGGLDQARAGDLLMMMYGEGGIPGPGHVGIYTKPGQMIHDPTPGGHVEFINIWETPGDIRRLLGPAGIIGGTGSPFLAAAGGSPQHIAAQMLADRGQGSEWPMFNQIVMWESGWDVHAHNASGAYGIPQALPASKMASAGPDWQNDPATQLRWMFQYIDQVYGGIPQAYAFHVAHGWYDQGGMLPPGMSMMANATGKPEPVLTDTQWANIDKLASGGMVGGLATLASGGHVPPAERSYLEALHKAAVAAQREVTSYLKAVAREAKKQADAHQRAVNSYLKALAKQQAQIDKFGIGLVKSTEAGPLKAGQAAIKQAVKEGNGPLQKHIGALLTHAEAGLYATGLSAVRDKKLSPQEFTSVQSWAKQVTSLTGTLTKLNTVNQGLVDSLKTYVQSQQQFRDSLVQSVSQGSGFSDILKLSGSPADVRTVLSSKMGDLKAYTTKMGKLIDKGFSPSIVRDISGDGIQTAMLYADVLLQSSAADVKAIDKGFGDLSGATAFAANAITSRTQNAIPGISQPGAINYINQAIFTTTDSGGSLSASSSDLLIGKAEFTQRTGIPVKKMDGGGMIYPGRSLIDNESGQQERVLNPAQTRAWEQGAGGRHVTIEKMENNYNGVDLPTAHAQSNRDLSLALTRAGI